MSIKTEKTKAPKKAKAQKIDTTNPMGAGVSYAAFLKNVTKDNTVEKMCKKHKLTTRDIAWIKQELKQINN